MRRLLLILSLIVPELLSSSVGMTQTRLPAPFDTTFEFDVSIHGTFKTQLINCESPHPDGYFTFTTVVHPDASNWCHISGDTLNYFNGVDSVLMIFDLKTKHINQIRIYHYLNQTYKYEEWHVSLSNFIFDDSSIFTGDSTLSAHLEHVDYFWQLAIDGLSHFSRGESELTSTSSIDLSGIFRPIRISNKIAEVGSNQSSKKLSILFHDSMQPLKLITSLNTETLEVYSLLGDNITFYKIFPGETSITIPHLPAGLYFIRLGDQVSKVWVPE